MTTEQVGVRLFSDVKSFTDGFNSAYKSVTYVKSGLDSVQSGFAKVDNYIKSVGQRMFVTGLGFTASTGLMVKGAADLESKMRFVNTITQEGRQGFLSMTNQIIDMSREVPKATGDLADALYDISSSGFAGAEGMTVLEASAKAATAGLTQTQVASQAISSALNAYGLGVEKATDVSDILFQTVNVGVLTFQELSEGMGDWIGTAAAAKIPLADASAALATMTLSGIQAAEASTALTRVMQSFLSPTEMMTKAANGLGYANSEAMLRTLGLQGSVQALSETAGGSSTALQAIYGDVRALNGALALGAQGGELYRQSVAAIGDPQGRAGATAEAMREAMKSLNSQLTVLKNSVTAAGIELGMYLLPPMELGVRVAQSFLDVWEDIPGPIKAVAAYSMALGSILLTVGGFILMSNLRLVAFKTLLGAVSPTAAAAVSKANSLSGAFVRLGVRARYGADGLERLDSIQSRVSMGIGILRFAALAATGVMIGLSLANMRAANTAAIVDERVRKFRETLGNESDLESIKRNNDATIAELNRLKDAARWDDDNKDAGLFFKMSESDVTAAFDALNPFNEDRMDEARGAYNKLAGLSDEQTQKYMNMAKNLRIVQDVLGVGATQAYDIAQKNNIDLTVATDASTESLIYQAKVSGEDLPAGLVGGAAAMVDLSNKQADVQAKGDALMEQWKSMHGPGGEFLDIGLSEFQKDLQGALEAIGGFGASLSDVESALKTEQERKQQEALDAIQARQDALKKAAQDEAETTRRAQQDQESAFSGTDQALQGLKNTNEDVIAAIGDRADAEIEALERQKQALQEQEANVQLSAENYLFAFSAANSKLQTYMGSMTDANRVIGTMFTGDEATLMSENFNQAVAAMGDKGQEFLTQFLNAPPDVQRALVEQMALNSTLLSDQMVVNMDMAMSAATKTAQDQSGTMAQDIAEQLGLHTDVFVGTGEAWGWAIINSMNGVILNNPPSAEGDIARGRTSQEAEKEPGRRWRQGEDGKFYPDGGGSLVTTPGGHLEVYTGRAKGGWVAPGSSVDVGELGKETLHMSPSGGGWVFKNRTQSQPATQAAVMSIDYARMAKAIGKSTSRGGFGIGGNLQIIAPDAKTGMRDAIYEARKAGALGLSS